MKKPSLAFFLLITVVLAVPACAEIYKYVDENGQKRWTDDLSQVPKAQRPSAQRVESEEETSPQGVTTPAQTARLESPLETKAASTPPPIETAEPSRESLEKEKAALDARYQQLMEERKQLERIKAEEGGFDSRAELNERISEYNRNTEQYELQLSNFNKKIQAYNQNILSKKPQPAE
jgi:hypothetical protein